LLETLKEINKEYNLDTNELIALNKMTEESAINLVLIYIERYIFQKWKNEVSANIEEKDVSYKKLETIEKQSKRYIKVKIKTIYKKKEEWLKLDNFKKGVEEIFRLSYLIIEGEL